MTTRKRPLAELSQSQIQTPSRYAPSTPHAIRALQQRSGAKTRSVRTRKFNGEIVRPDSARGILRRLAKITAPLTKKTLKTPKVANGKENQVPEDDLDNEDLAKKPRMTFDIEESIEESLNEDDSLLATAPTPSILPEDESYPTMTFKSIDFGLDIQPGSEKIDRRKSKLFFAGQDEDQEEEEDEPTILTERGRRAISEEPTGRLSRYSFGSIRMSDFGPDLEIRRDSNQEVGMKGLNGANETNALDFDFDDEQFDIVGETENLRRFRSTSAAPVLDITGQIPTVDESFELGMPEEPRSVESSRQNARSEGDFNANREDIGAVDGSRKLTQLETAASSAVTKSHRRRLKMTRHGLMVPSLPSSLVKRVTIETQKRLGQRRCALSREHMKALEQATEWFLEQIGEDLGAYSDHARRKKTINEADILILMRRQRVLRGHGDLQRMAKDWLPPKFLAELDLPEKI